MPPSWMRFTRTASVLAATAGLPDCLDRPEPLYHLLPATPCQPAGSLLVNTARGAVLDTEALVAALDSGHLGGAALDVYETEPLEPDHPLTGCEHVVLTPHCADQTPEGNDLLNQGCVENVIAFLSGRPQNVVT